MRDVAGELRRSRQRLFDRLDAGHQALDRWRERARAGYAAVEAREAAARPDGITGVPDGAPPQYRVVAAKVERGDFTWFDVLSGNVTDLDARRMHRWLDTRIELIRRAYEEVERGATVAEAMDIAVGALARPGER